MKRNLESRVEVVTPVEAPELRASLREILDVQLTDHRSAWEMQADGSYVQRQPRSEAEERGSHQVLIRRAEERQKAALRLKKRKPKGISVERGL